MMEILPDGDVMLFTVMLPVMILIRALMMTLFDTDTQRARIDTAFTLQVMPDCH